MIRIKPSFDTTARFNELLNLWDANETKNKQVTEETFKTLGQLFLNYHIENIFALTLLHKHFLLKENEILLETGSLSDYQREVISQPVEVNKLASSVEGFNWMVTPDKSYIPYEFRYEDKDNKIDFSSPEIKCFLEEFSLKLIELNLAHVFGICAINEENCHGLEHTEGRKNITLPFTESNTSNNIEGVWSFRLSPNSEEEKIVTRDCVRDCERSCLKTCSDDDDGHRPDGYHSPSHRWDHDRISR